MHDFDCFRLAQGLFHCSSSTGFAKGLLARGFLAKLLICVGCVLEFLMRSPACSVWWEGQCVLGLCGWLADGGLRGLTGVGLLKHVLLLFKRDVCVSWMLKTACLAALALRSRLGTSLVAEQNFSRTAEQGMGAGSQNSSRHSATREAWLQMLGRDTRAEPSKQFAFSAGHLAFSQDLELA